jgi:hypothetical protein
MSRAPVDVAGRPLRAPMSRAPVDAAGRPLRASSRAPVAAELLRGRP